MAKANPIEKYYNRSIGDFMVMLATMTLAELRKMDLERAQRAWKLRIEWMREYHRREVEFKTNATAGKREKLL